jgi:hypothetical protein
MRRLHLHNQKVSQARKYNEAGASCPLNMEATSSSETSVDFQRNTWRYISEDRTLNNHHCENLKPYTNWVIGKGNQQ